MKIDRRALKARAREAMGQTQPRFWAVALVYILLTTGVQIALSLLLSALPGGTSGIFLNILFFLYSTVILFGLRLWSLWAWRKLDPGMGALTQGFSIPGRVILMELFIFVRVFGWALLFILALSIFALPLSAVLAASPILYLPYAGALYVLIWVFMLRYNMAPYLLADRPDDGPSLAIRRSVEMMRGRKRELFKLQLSFLGWEAINWALSLTVFFFLCAQAGLFQMPVGLDSLLLYQSVANGLVNVALSGLVTLPLSLWLLPYQGVTRAGFYDARLQAQQRSAPPL